MGRLPAQSSVGATVSDPQHPEHVYAASGAGLFRSDDGGQTWERRDNGIKFPNIYALNFVHAGSETRMYAGTEPAHLYVSTDLGQSWTELPALRRHGGSLRQHRRRLPALPWRRLAPRWRRC